MKNVMVLDCTLRDGGRLFDCKFPDEEIKEITRRLSLSKIDIVEVGFLRDAGKIQYKGNSTFFTDVDQIIPFIDKNKKNTLYVAFIDFGLFDFATLKYCDGKSVDGIRFAFTKKDYIEHYDELIDSMNIIKEKGYKLFIQGVNSLNYSDREILELVDMVNSVHPYSFGIVDTYGAMYIDDIDRLYRLINHNMLSDICINFHSHNNYQLSFAFAQEVIKLSQGTRNIIIDGTLNGMGKIAGNLNTELIVDYLVRKMHYDYEFNDILDIIDDYIYKYRKTYQWGYSIPAMMAGVYKAHPNNIIYLTEKFRLDTKDIGNILAMINPDMRQRYDYDNIEKLYIEYVAKKVDDYEDLNILKELIADREVVMLVPGSTLNTMSKMVSDYIEDKNPVVISVNFVTDIPNALVFYGNQKRYNLNFEKREGHTVIVSSNVETDHDDDLIINYYSLINMGYKYFENSSIMLLNLLKRIQASKITIAGFDGFDSMKESNYTDDSFQNVRHVEKFKVLNDEIASMLREYCETIAGKCELKFLTPSIFEDCVNLNKYKDG